LLNQTRTERLAEPELITMCSVHSSVSAVAHSICIVELNVLYSSYIPVLLLLPLLLAVPQLLLQTQELAKNCQKNSLNMPYVC